MSESLTLDPPGSIAVVGAGPLGIEAALYGRYLGYDVTLIEAVSVGHSLEDQRDQPLPMLPDRCLSPLAVSAIGAQSPDGPPFALPMTVSEWIDDALIAITETDLLRGRLRCPARVIAITKIPIEPDENDDPDDDLPPDFRLTLQDDETIDVEAVILATGIDDSIKTDFALPADYLFRIGEERSGDPERDFLVGLKQIVSIYAALAGRETLDLYRPRRG